MKASSTFITKSISTPPKPTPPVFTQTSKFNPNVERVFEFRPRNVRFPVPMSTSWGHSSSPVIESGIGSDSSSYGNTPGNLEASEENIEKAIYGCRFMALLGVSGSLVGSFLCFIKGCTFVASSFMEYFVNRGKVILLLVEAIGLNTLKLYALLAILKEAPRIDRCLSFGTVMLVFGMGLYELFVSNLDSAKSLSEERLPHQSNFFGLFTLKERPKWLDVKTVNGLKTKLGHVIVMLLLIGLLDKSKKALLHSPADLRCFSASILLSSGSLFLLSKLNESN